MDNTMTMQTALDNFTQNMESSLSSILNAYNQEIIENNETIQQADSLEEKNIELLETNERQLYQLNAKDTIIIEREQRITELERKVLSVCADRDIATKIATDNMTATDQANRELAQTKLTLADKDLTITNFKKIGSSPKKINEKIKRFQKTISDNQLNKSAQQVKSNKTEHNLHSALKRIAEQDWIIRDSKILKVYSKEGHNLFIYPNLVDTANLKGGDTGFKKEIAFLYLNDNAKGGLMTLDTDDESIGFPQARGSAAIRPNTDVKNFGASLLRKLKSQNWQLTEDDLNLELQ
jgi:hypothetical protein